jgi:tRNA threonylcarbamoyladenosine biosynthesis protein TsaB
LKILAIDTALQACSACITDRDRLEPVARESLSMAKGHAEALMPLLERVVAKIEGGFLALDKIVVTVGPGSYTGLRVGISAARGIGLATRIPVVGVTTLSALLAPLIGGGSDRLTAVAIDARHGQVYFQAVAPGGRVVVPAALMPVREAVRLMGSGPVILTGSGAPLVAAEAWAVGVDASVDSAPLAPDIGWIARLGLAADPQEYPPRPLYLRSPDARPQDHARIAQKSE